MPSIERNGTQISWDESGSGPPIVLIHSFLFSRSMWRKQTPTLSRTHRVITIDVRGHGESGQVSEPCSLYDLVGDIVAVLDHLGIERAVWGGLSIGGMISIRAALTVPERVSALILIDTHAGAETGFKKFKYRLLAVGARFLGIEPFLPFITPLMFGATTRRENREIVEDWKRHTARKLHVPSILRILDGALIHRDDVTPSLGEIGVPALVVVGEEDRTLPPVCSRRIADGIPEATLITVPRAGHISALEQPEIVNEAIVTFLEA